MLLEDPGHMMPDVPDCECVATTAPPNPSTSSANAFGVHVLVGLRAGVLQVGHVEPGRKFSVLGRSNL